MAQFWWFFKLLFLLLMMSARAPTIESRPMRGMPPHSDLIAGNEFLKLFLERDELQREMHSSEYRGRGDGGGGGQRSDQLDADIVNNFAGGAEEFATTTKTAATASHQRHRGRNSNSNKNDDSKQVQLVTSGSKIVFLEEYDDNDAVVDAVARDIDLQKEKTMKTTTLKSHYQQKLHHQQQQQKHYHRKSNPGDEIKVVAVSQSSSSKRSSPSQERPAIESATQVNKFAEKSSQVNKHHSTTQVGGRRQQQQQQQQQKMQQNHHNSELNDNYRTTLSTLKPTMATTAIATTTTTTTTTLPSTTVTDFINRSHKSEFSIEEAEPLTMLQHKARSVYSRSAPVSSSVTLQDDSDSENSASTNIQNVLAVPLDQIAEAAYHSSSGSTRNSTPHSQLNINQTPPPLSSQSHVLVDDETHDSDADGIPNTSTRPIGGDDKLLPFQTVIYHDTKQGHGPQSRSISYSSISQNVEDLRTWQQSGILAEAQRNVSESLKPISRPTAHTHASEPAKFYSVPSKMYGEPAKFYSEPAKIYSEPAKVYGEPEKFYSEPAKVYGQPSKFYSEPAKVYSQPAKIYSEPAKTYWPHVAAVATTSSTTTTTTTATPTITTTLHPATTRPNSSYSSSRRPAIVSRIAFGEAQTTTSSSSPSVPTNFGQRSLSTPIPASSYPQHNSQANSQPRRVLFNLDKLPYDLLNAPQQSSKHLLEPDFLKSPPASVTYASARQRSCLEAAFSSSLSTSQQQHQQQQQRQYSSLLDQHSNQNAKGLPNRDLVKCVSKYSHSSAPTAGGASSQSHFTTERSHSEDLYSPTPEQNYEIEESVSVMTNGRAHGVHGGGGIGLAIATTTPTPTTKPTRSRNRFSGAALGGRHYNSNSHSNANANVADSENDNGGGGGGTGTGTTDQHHNNNYDDDDDSNSNNNNEDDADDSEDDVNDDGRVKSNDGSDDDDSKVAYVVEGRNYRKYRVEEKTDDGFIVGEYGVVDHNDGNLRGVRYTADSTINRSLIQKALLTFLKLK